MAATLTTSRIWNAFLGSHSDRRAFFHGHTYGGNPLAAAVGLESLNIFRDEGVLAQLTEKIRRLQQRLRPLADLKHVGDVRQRGLIAGIELVANKGSGESYDWREQRGMRACHAARKHGAILRPLGDVVAIVPPLCMSPEEIDRLVAAAEAGIREATAEAATGVMGDRLAQTPTA